VEWDLTYTEYLTNLIFFGCICIIRHSSRGSNISSSISSKLFISETILYGTNLSHVSIWDPYLNYSYDKMYLPNTCSTDSYFVVYEGWYLYCDKFCSVCSELIRKIKRTHSTVFVLQLSDLRFWSANTNKPLGRFGRGWEYNVPLTSDGFSRIILRVIRWKSHKLGLFLQDTKLSRFTKSCDVCYSNKEYFEERVALTVRSLSPATDSSSYTSKVGWIWTTTGQFYGSDEICDITTNTVYEEIC